MRPTFQLYVLIPLIFQKYKNGLGAGRTTLRSCTGIGDGQLRLRNIRHQKHRAEEVVRVVSNAQLSSVKPQRRRARSEIGLHLLTTRFEAWL